MNKIIITKNYQQDIDSKLSLAQGGPKLRTMSEVYHFFMLLLNANSQDQEEKDPDSVSLNELQKCLQSSPSYMGSVNDTGV